MSEQNLTEGFEKYLSEVAVEDTRVAQIATEINTIKRQSAQTMLQAAVEIGRLLCEAKEKVPYGSWGDWLQSNVDYSVSNANNMMRLYNEYMKAEQIDMFGDNGWDLFEGLSMSKVLALLPLPPHERKEMIEQNNVEEMSVRELQAAVKAREDAEKRAQELADRVTKLEDAEERAAAAEAKADDFEGRWKTVKSAWEKETEAADKLERDLLKADDEIERIKAERDAALANPQISEKDRKAIENAEKEKYEKKLAAVKEIAAKEKETAVADAAAEARNKGAEEANRLAEEKIAEAERRAKEAKEKLSASAVASSPTMTKFKVHLDLFKSEYRALSDLIESAELDEPEIAPKLRAVMQQITSALAAESEGVESDCAEERNEKRLDKGDVVYIVRDNLITEARIQKIIYDVEGLSFDEDAIGNDVFLTEEDANNALYSESEG